MERKIVNQQARNTARGMTLIEIMIVLAIIALVMGLLVGPKVLQGLKSSQRKVAWLMTQEYVGAYTRWAADNSEQDCPAQLEDLLKYTNKKDTKDPWGSKYIMKCGESAPEEASGFGVISMGKDKKDGTSDDIKSWEKQPN
jgi:general secretion pathway protein G